MTLKLTRTLVLTLATVALATGCLLKKTQTVTTDPVTGASITNTVTTVNQANLALECSALELVGTPAVTYVLANDKSGEARTIVADIQVALQGALNGADTNITATINGLISKNPAVQAQFTPLVQAASNLRGSLLTKYGSTAGVQITTAVLQADLDIVTAALTAVPAPIPAK